MRPVTRYSTAARIIIGIQATPASKKTVDRSTCSPSRPRPRARIIRYKGPPRTSENADGSGGAAASFTAACEQFGTAAAARHARRATAARNTGRPYRRADSAAAVGRHWLPAPLNPLRVSAYVELV